MVGKVICKRKEEHGKIEKFNLKKRQIPPVRIGTTYNTDNGAPLAHINSLSRLSKLSVWFLAGIQEILFPHKPAHMIRADPDRPNISYNVIPVLSKNRELRRLRSINFKLSGVHGPPEDPIPLLVPKPVKNPIKYI